MFADLTTTRFPNGVTNNDVSNLFNSLKTMDPTQFITFLDEFLDFVPTAWTVTEVGVGTQTLIANGNGGRLLLTNAAADDDLNQIQKGSGAYVPIAGQKFFMKCKFQLADVLQSDFAIGVQIVNADGTDLAVATDGIFFLKADGAATIALYIRRDNASGSVNSGAIATLVNATDVILGAFYDGGDRVYYSVDGAVLGYVTIIPSTQLPNVGCAPIISLKNGEAVAKTATIDGLFVAQERGIPY